MAELGLENAEYFVRSIEFREKIDNKQQSKDNQEYQMFD